MANNKEILIEMIAKIATLAAKTAVYDILERKQEDIYTRCRCEITGVKQHRHNGHSPGYTSTEKVNNSLHNSETLITKMKHRCKTNIVRVRHKILMEKEDNQTVKSL